MMTGEKILNNLPYAFPFLFVDELLEISEESIQGKYTFRSNLPFYQGHFIGNPVTPGVILTECCAQIGLVCLGLYLTGNELKDNTGIALTSSEMEFLLPVFPGESVTVTSQKIYYRFHKLKCAVKMFNQEGKLVCKGILAGMINVSDA